MKNRFTLFFAALLMTLGVCAQALTEGQKAEIAQRGAEKGYYPFAAEITGMEKLTSLDQITDGMEIMIERDGSYLTIYSLPTYGAAHKVFMQNKPVGVGVWTTKTVDANAGTFQLKSAHMMIKGGECYLGAPSSTAFTTTSNTKCTYEFELNTSDTHNNKWALKYSNEVELWGGATRTETGFLCVAPDNGELSISKSDTKTENCYFNIYKVTKRSTAQVKYVEADVHLTGPSGNVISLEHQGWNDFYEFIMNNQAFKCTMTNTQYDESRNLITADMTYPFAVSGNTVKVPMYIHADKNATKRVIVDGNTIKVVNKDDITAENEANSQWYFFPKVIWGKYYDPYKTYANAPEAYKVVYAIQNVETGDFINYTTHTAPFTLSSDTIYFDCTGSLTDTYFRFKFEYTTSTTSTFLHNNSNVIKPLYLSGDADCNFYLSKVPTPTVDLGFVQYIPYGTSFWNCGVTDGYPDSFEADNYWDDNNLHEGANPDNKWDNHYLYCAETTVEVNALSSIVASFEHTGGINRLQIFGVDIVGQTAEGEPYSERDYHLGYAGDNPQNYIYTLGNVPPGNYTLRYWVCHADGHNLNHFQGKVTVTGANLRFKTSDAPNSEWAQNTTWYTFNLGNQYNNYLDAQPAYTDVQDNLQLTNATLPTDAAALWCFVGNETDGYKIYNRAWGPGYVLATTGEGANARTTMMSEEEASRYGVYSRYDVMLKEHNDHGAWFIRLHGTNTTFLMKQSDYLAVQNSTSTYDAHDAVFNIHEVMLTDSYDTQLTDVVMGQILSAYWTPWTANSNITSAPTNFVSLVKGRIAAAQALHGKAFKFVSKSTTGNRTNKVLSLNGDKKIAGIDIDATEKVNDFMLLLHNGDGTMSLYHMATGQCFGLPSDATTTDEASATPYTFMMKKDEANTVTFVTGNQMMHLQNSGSSETFEITNYNDLNDDASRWSVVFDTEAQQLADSIMKARAKYDEVQLDEYRANVGVPGYVANTHESVINLPVEVKSLDGLTIEEAKAKISSALKAIATEESRVFFPTDCYFTITNKYGRGSVTYDGSNEYLNTVATAGKDNREHLWGFYYDEISKAYYLYNVAKIQFANPEGEGEFPDGTTWTFSNIPAKMKLTILDIPYFHIQGGNKEKTMSISSGYTGPVITYYNNGDAGVPMRFEKATIEVDPEVTAAIAALLKSELNTQKQATIEFLNATPLTVGYPNAEERTTLENAITNATTVDEVTDALDKFKTTNNINVPENGKTYKISAWWRNRTWPLTFVDDENKPEGYNCATPAYVPVENGEATIFVCRKLNNGTYAFVSNSGYYLGWQTDEENTNATSTEFAGATYWKVEKSRADYNSGGLNSEEIFGKVNIVAERTSGNWYDYMFNCDDKKFHNGQPGAKHYDDNGNTVYYIFEEVEYTLNKVKLTAISESDKLINGLEGAIGTFSAPYATVIPEGVTAYYAKATSTGAENSSAILEVVEGAIPAGEGVILVGETAVQVEMLPVAGETKATLEKNYLIGTGATPVEMQTGDFILADGDQGIGFYQATGTLRAGKAYIQFGGAVNSLVLKFGGNTTDIDAVTTVTPSNDELIYDIYGRRVTEVKKGNIYIKNGKKFIVK